ncbi:nucleoside deaminase [Saprospira grandis]|uniref:tRNA-specific adenosine deaminase n=1 Tax=Saprospira grandis (strain Lewin) TaxID=984262 RepID=H6L3L4_SAPGL|nr:nucleoside deaminase [Saprospira grandis]AFC24962.1 cmp/dcmp deaminase zinc-binding protein [Saprospira grandis str. Lewin]
MSIPMDFNVFSDEFFMRQALLEAQKAFELDEVPVGAVLVAQNQILARAHNRTEALTDISAHAEILAITAAAQALDSKYLPKATLYVTLEPCLMCAGALAWAQIGRIVYAAADPKRGFLALAPKALHPKTKLEQGPLAEEAQALLQSFFKRKR